MKALIIADDETVIERVSEAVKTCGYDVIVYRWLLKALDNIEEIAPQLIIVSAKDYPRHWKTLVQFVSCNAAEPQMILYTGGAFSEEEAKKASLLQIRGTFPAVDDDGIAALQHLLARNAESESEEPVEAEEQAHIPAVTRTAAGASLTASSRLSAWRALNTEADAEDEAAYWESGERAQEDCEPELTLPQPATADKINVAKATDAASSTIAVKAMAEPSTPNVEKAAIETAQEAPQAVQTTNVTAHCSIIFTNPLTGALVTGMCQNYNGETVEFTPDLPLSLSVGTQIPSLSLESSGSLTAFMAKVISASQPLVLKLI